MLALATMLTVAYAWGPGDGFRDSCARVSLDEPLCDAYHELGATGAHYSGFVSGEHRWIKDVRFCALRVDEDGRVVSVRYLEPASSWHVD